MAEQKNCKSWACKNRQQSLMFSVLINEVTKAFYSIEKVEKDD